MLVRQNMHTHTRISYCGGRDSTIANTVHEAESVGLEMVGISDHIDCIGSGREPLFQINRDELATINTNVKVLIGAELSIQSPDALPAPAEFVESLDYVLISANHFHVPCVMNPDEKTEEAYADWFLVMADAAVGFGASIIPHPFSYIGVRTMEGGREVDFPRLLKAYDRGKVRELFRKASERGTAFELNPGRMGYHDFFRELFGIARDEGMKFSFGSDGHHPGAMDYGGIDKLAEIDAMFVELGVTDDIICHDYAVRR